MPDFNCCDYEKFEPIFELQFEGTVEQALFEFDHTKHGDIVLHLGCKFNYPNVVEKMLLYTDTVDLEHILLDGLYNGINSNYKRVVHLLLADKRVLKQLKSNTFKSKIEGINAVPVEAIRKKLIEQYDFIKSDADIDIFLNII